MAIKLTNKKLSLVVLFDDLLSIPNCGYSFCNHADKTNNNYECSIIDTLEKHGFFTTTMKELFKIEYPEWDEILRGKKKEHKAAFSEFKEKLELGTLKLNNFHSKAYIWQPFGSQKHPDFFLIDNVICQAFEAKSGKNTKVQFNSGIPKNENQIYIFSVKEGVGSALAKRIFTSSVLNEIRNLEESFNDNVKNCNYNMKMLKYEEENNYHLQYYVRRMIQHTEPVVGNNNKKDLEEVKNYIKGLYE